MTFRDIESFNKLRTLALESSVEKIIKLGPPVAVSSSRSVTASDIGCLLYTITTSATTITVPSDLTSTIGASFHVLQWYPLSSGEVDLRGDTSCFVRATTGISTNNSGPVISLRTTYSMVTVIQITLNNWVVVGDIL